MISDISQEADTAQLDVDLEEITAESELATNIPGRFVGNVRQLEWCSQSSQWSEVMEKHRHPVL